jgi:hypothetical protein
VKRLALAALLLIAGAGLLSACGKGGSATTSTTTAKAPAHAPASHAPTQAQAQAFAHAVNLRAGDIPGFKASSEKQPKHETAEEKRLQQKLRQCTGANGASDLADVASKEFKHPIGPFSLSVSSGVSVSQSAAAAAAELKALHAHNVRSCLAQYVQQVLASHRFGHVTVAPVSVAEGSPPAPGMTGSFGWRITSGLEVRGIRIPFYMDILGFVDGPAQVSLESFGIPRAFPAQAEEQLFALLLRRAAAQRL